MKGSCRTASSVKKNFSSSFCPSQIIGVLCVTWFIKISLFTSCSSAPGGCCRGDARDGYDCSWVAPAPSLLSCPGCCSKGDLVRWWESKAGDRGWELGEMWKSNRETRNHSFGYQKVSQMCLIQHPKHCKWDGARTQSLPPWSWNQWGWFEWPL